MKPINLKLIQISFLFAISLALATTTQAALLTITNSSFENPDAANGTFVGSQTAGPAGWTVYNTGPTNNNRFFGVWDPTSTLSFDFPLPQGQQVGVVFLDDTIGLEAGLQQTLSNTLQLSTAYTLNVAVGNFRFTIGDPWNFVGFPGYRVDLMAGSTILSSDNNTLTPNEGQFLTSTVSFTTGLSHPNAGQLLRIRLVSLNGSGVEVNFDNVLLDATAIPEPSTTTAVFGGIIIIGALLKRHRNSRKD